MRPPRPPPPPRRANAGAGGAGGAKGRGAGAARVAHGRSHWRPLPSQRRPGRDTPAFEPSCVRELRAGGAARGGVASRGKPNQTKPKAPCHRAMVGRADPPLSVTTILSPRGRRVCRSSTSISRPARRAAPRCCSPTSSRCSAASRRAPSAGAISLQNLQPLPTRARRARRARGRAAHGAARRGGRPRRASRRS